MRNSRVENAEGILLRDGRSNEDGRSDRESRAQPKETERERKRQGERKGGSVSSAERAETRSFVCTILPNRTSFRAGTLKRYAALLAKYFKGRYLLPTNSGLFLLSYLRINSLERYSPVGRIFALHSYF